jgi:hypothetical protein
MPELQGYHALAFIQSPLVGYTGDFGTGKSNGEIGRQQKYQRVSRGRLAGARDSR